MGAPRTRYDRSAEKSTSAAYRIWVRHLWYTRYLRWRKRAQVRPWSQTWYQDAMCVHSHEGAWNDDTGNSFYGGMQMNAGFEEAYGPQFVREFGINGGAWPPVDQLLAAYRGWQARGWEPWPNTAAMCGLL